VRPYQAACCASARPPLSPSAHRSPETSSRRQTSRGLAFNEAVVAEVCERARAGPMSRTGGAATRSLDGADPAELADPGDRGPVEQHLDRRLSVAFDKHTVRLIEPRRPLPAVAVGGDERCSRGGAHG